MAAAVGGVFPVCLDQQQSLVEDEEKKKKQILMERLRNKRNPHHRSWTDNVMKYIRSNLDKKGQPDATERNQVQKCLDTLQRAMKVISQQTLVERLRLIARQQGLESYVLGSDQPVVKIDGDMFFIEIMLNKGGGVKEVKIKHQGDSSTASQELKDILSRCDFTEFTSHLEGLQSIYRVTGEKKLKSKAFQALHSLESDLNGIAQLQNSSIIGVANYIHKSPLGILVPRTAGKPMKLIYFVSPYDLLDKKTKTAYPMTLEAITEHGLGRSATVCLEPGPETKLQTMTLVSYTKQPGGGCLPSFNGLTPSNSVELPARFVLVLSQPVPVAKSVVCKIQTITEIDPVADMGSQPLLSLILDSNSDGKMKKSEALFVSLPDQDHRYYINGVAGGILDEPGVMLSRIPFFHPTNVPKILNLLRQQLIFNTILASCVRPCARKDPPACLVFEMTVISLSLISVTFEHPAHDTMVTVDIDFSEITNLKCRLLEMNATSPNFQPLCTDDYACKVMQRSLSLPILFRALVRSGRVQLEKKLVEAKEAEEQARKAHEAAVQEAHEAHRRQQQLLQQQQQARLAAALAAKARQQQSQAGPHSTPTYAPTTPSPLTSSNPPSVGGIGDLRGMSGGVDLLNSSPPGYSDILDKGGHNPLLVNLLDSERGLPPHSSSPGLGMQLHQQQQQSLPQQPIAESPMLSRLLDDNISVATNITPINNPSVSAPQPPGMPQSVPQLPKTKGMKGRKRRSQSDMIMTGRSPKHRLGDGDGSVSLDMESSSSPFESSQVGAYGLGGFHHQMGPSPARPPSQGQMSGIIDLTDENPPDSSSSLKKLEDFSNREGFGPSDMRPGISAQDSELQALLGRADHHGNSSSPSINMTGLKPNQMTGPKNENASTSPEGHLIGSGEVGKASLPDPAASHLVHVGQQLAPHQMAGNRFVAPAAFLGHGQATAKGYKHDLDTSSGGLQHPDRVLPKDVKPEIFRGKYAANCDFLNRGDELVPAPNRGLLVSSSSMTDLPEIKPPVGKKGFKHSNSTSSVASICPSSGDARSLFEKFDYSSLAVPHVHIVSNSSGVGNNGGDGEDLTAPKVRIKMPQFRGPPGKAPEIVGLVQSPSSAGSKSSNSNTMFDFHSDEEEEEQSFSHVPSTVNVERLTVYASSPTRLQISSKVKPPAPLEATAELMETAKPEKNKRSKEKGSGTGKRKKDRVESRREKKRKKAEHDRYITTVNETVYHASTIEGDQKTGTKLKIRVSKEPIITTTIPHIPSMKEPVVSQGRMDVNPLKAEKFSEKVTDALMKRRNVNSAGSVSSLSVDKLVVPKQELKDQQSDEGSRDSTDLSHLYRSSSTSKSKSGNGGKISMAGAGSSSNSALSKNDPKLAKATIRLKPLSLTTVTTSASAIGVASSAKPTSSGQSSSSSSNTERGERRQAGSASTPVSTPTTSGPLCISTYLPDAPTPKSVASLPKIPRVSASVSTTAAISSATTTTSATTTKLGVGGNSGAKAGVMNPGFNNSFKSSSPSMGPSGSGRASSIASTSNALKSSAMGFNRAGGHGLGVGLQKTSPKTFSNSSLPPGILKNSGNVSGATAQKTPASGSQGPGKVPGGGGNQTPNSFSRVSNSTSQGGTPSKLTPSGQHGSSKNSPNSSMGPHKGNPGSQGSVPRTMSGSGGNVQRSPNFTQSTGIQRSPNQGANIKVSGSPNQNMGPQKVGLPAGKTGGSSGGSTLVGNQHKSYAQAGPPSHKTVSQGSTSFSSKSPVPGGWSSPSHTQGQKGAGSQGRSTSTGSLGTSPNSSGGNNSGRTVSSGSSRSNSMSGACNSGGVRTPPNHLSVNRSMSTGQKAGSSGSSPRIPSTQSLSTPTTAPKFPSTLQQKSSVPSASNVSQRPSSSSQSTNQRSNSTSGNTQSPGQRPVSSTGQRASPVSQPQRSLSSTSVNSGSGQNLNQRPASTPGVGNERRTGGEAQSSAHPARPSSAGPRQASSSPSGPRMVMPNPLGQGAVSSSPSAGHTSSPNRQGQQKSNGGNISTASTASSSLVCRSSGIGDTSDSKAASLLLRQNSSGTLNTPTPIRPAAAGSGPAIDVLASKQGASVGVENGPSSSSSALETTKESVSVSQSSGQSERTTVSSLSSNTTSEVKTTAVNQNSVSAANASASRQVPSISASVTPTAPKSATPATASSLQSSGSVQSTTLLQTGSVVLPVTSRTSVGASVGSGKTSANTPGKALLNKTSVSSVGGSVKPVPNIPRLAKPPAGSVKPAAAVALSSTPQAGNREQNVTGAGYSTVTTKCPSGTSSTSSVSTSSNTAVSLNSSSGVKEPSTTPSLSGPKCESSVSSNNLVGGAASVLTAVGLGGKSVSGGAARGRKNSLSAILDKLNNRAAVSSISESGESIVPPSISIASKVNELVPKDVKKMEDAEEVKAGVKRSASVSGLSPTGPEAKLQRLEQAHKSQVPAIPVPPSPAHTTPPHTSPSFASGGAFCLERRWSGEKETNGEMVGLDLSSKREIVLDLTMPKDLTVCKEKLPASVSAPAPPPHPESRDKVSPRSGSPCVGADGKVVAGTKFNGQDKDRCRAEVDFFKVPTPFTQPCEDVDGIAPGRVTASPVCSIPMPSRPLSAPAPSSPVSDASSSDELIIDCGEMISCRPFPAKTATSTPSIMPSPKLVRELANDVVSGHSSPNSSLGKSSPSHNVCKNSPQISPHHKHPSPCGQTSVSPAANDTEAGSPYMLDDDLMDMALTG